MAKVRYQMFIEEEQKRFLEEMQRRLKVPVAELIRRAIETYRRETVAKKAGAGHDREAALLLSVGGVCEGGADDLADRHNAYLYGTRKK